MRNKHKRRTGIGIISFVVLILCGIILLKRIGLVEEKKDKEIVIEKLDTSIDDEEDRAKEITKEEAYRQTDRYIEDIAREKLGLVYEDEIILKPED